MALSKHLFHGVATVTLALFLIGCTPVNVITGAGATAGSIALGDAGFNVGISDAEMQIKVSKKLSENNSQDFDEVSVEVLEGRVMLTGVVASENMLMNAGTITWQVPAVQEVINKITVGQKRGLWQKTQDLTTYTKLMSSLTAEKKVSAVNYKIKIFNDHAYVMGVARNREERDLVIAYIRATDGIVDFSADILLVDDQRRQENLQALRSYLEQEKFERQGIKPRFDTAKNQQNVTKTSILVKPAKPQQQDEAPSMKKIVIANPK